MKFEVFGQPAPQGSKRGFVNKRTGQVNMVESSQKVKPWREAVKHAALRQGAPPMFDDAVSVRLIFYMRRPQGHYGTGRNAGVLKASAPRHPATRPDLDKLTRSTLDGIREAGIYRDDSQVVTLMVSKYYADQRPPGASIWVDLTP